MDLPSNEREQEIENYVTTDTIVHSMTQVNQRFEDVAKARSTDERPTPGEMVRSMAAIHRLFKDVVKTNNQMQKVYVADLAPKIQIQQVAFNNCYKLLLNTAATNRQDVNNMIEDPGHPIWQDTVAHRNMYKVMTPFYHLCLKALEHCQESLKLLEGGFQALRDQVKRKGRKRYRSWLEGSKPPTFGPPEDLPKLVQSLRNYNDIFCTLVWQAVPRRANNVLGLSFAEDLGYRYTIGAAQASHSHFGCSRRASQVLYDTWSNVWTCRDHETHFFSISLKFDHAKASAIVQSGDLQFDMAVTSPHFDVPYRFVVDSAHADFCTCQMVEEDQSMKKTYTYLGNKVAGKAARTKSLDSSGLNGDTAAFRAGDQWDRTLMRPESVLKRVPDLGLEEDLCSFLRKSSANVEAKQGTGSSCLGFLKTRSGRKFLISSVFRTEYQRQGSQSLDDVLVRANSERRTIALKDRLRTASFLAAGFLHLHNSSWLPQAWSSKDIHFFDTDEYKRCALGEPFLRTRLDCKKDCGPESENKDSAATRSGLLSLGLVLIEIAFSAPWRKLQLEKDVTKDLIVWERELLNLIRLSETVSRKLGSRYAKVVQTCLLQGLGAQKTDGPRKVELDGIVYEEIVRELDQCISAVTSEPGM